MGRCLGVLTENPATLVSDHSPQVWLLLEKMDCNLQDYLDQPSEKYIAAKEDHRIATNRIMFFL